VLPAPTVRPPGPRSPACFAARDRRRRSLRDACRPQPVPLLTASDLDGSAGAPCTHGRLPRQRAAADARWRARPLRSGGQPAWRRCARRPRTPAIRCGDITTRSTWASGQFLAARATQVRPTDFAGAAPAASRRPRAPAPERIGPALEVAAHDAQVAVVPQALLEFVRGQQLVQVARVRRIRQPLELPEPAWTVALGTVAIESKTRPAGSRNRLSMRRDSPGMLPPPIMPDAWPFRPA
jgi:hypothetical protein